MDPWGKHMSMKLELTKTMLLFSSAIMTVYTLLAVMETMARH